MRMIGCQWGHIELRCSSRALRVLGELPKASRDLYDHSAHSHNDRGHSENYGRIAFGACPGIEANQGRAVQ